MRISSEHFRAGRMSGVTGTVGTALRGVFLAALLAFSLDSAVAGSDEAAVFIEEAGAAFLHVANPLEGGAGARTSHVGDFLEQHTALRTIARFTAGRVWRQMTDVQRDAYQLALRDLAARFLVKRVEDAEDPEYRVVRSAELPDNKGFLVTTQLTGAGVSDLMVDWRVTEKDGQFRIVDVIMEGVSLLVTYRSEVAAVLEAERNNIDALIANLRERAGS